MVLVLNKWIEPEIGRKCKPYYLRPIAVVWRLRNGAYILVEVNRMVLYLKFAAFCLIPYCLCSQKYLEITEFVDQRDLEGVETEEEGEIVEDN